MSDRLLTIAIPTYNRADLLDQQLEWVARVIQGHESECEILVSDNCSTDHTQAVIQKWQAALHSVRFRTHKNTENIGLIANIAACIRAAQTEYVWTIGDDDPIQDRSLSFILQTIKKYPDLSVLFLNFSGRNKVTGEPVSPPTTVGNRWLDANCDEGSTDGKALFEYCLNKSLGSVSFLSAIIYRSELAQRSLQIWGASDRNWDGMVYWSGYCAAHGRVIVTSDIFLECIVGVSYWQKDPQHALMMQFRDASEVYRNLRQIGYSEQFYLQMMMHAYREANLRVFLGALRRWPLLTLKTAIPFVFEVLIAALKLRINSLPYLKKSLRYQDQKFT